MAMISFVHTALEVLKIVTFNFIVVVSIEVRRTRMEKSCNFICLSSINKVLLLVLPYSYCFPGGLFEG